MNWIIPHLHKAGGWLSFDAFMELALFDARYGYYSHNLKAIGTDFQTAPQMGNLLARILHQFLNSALGQRPDPILEIGAGNGTLCADLMDEIWNKNSETSYKIIEKSDKLQQIQRKLLAQKPFYSSIHWLDYKQLKAFDGIVFFHELLDALPCKRFYFNGRRFIELGVALDEHEALQWQLASAQDGADDAAFHAHIAEQVGHSNLACGYSAEWCAALRPWMADLSARMRSAVWVIVDYGYERDSFYHPQRMDGTLCAYRHHRLVDPLAAPGQCDLSCHVNFSEVARCAEANGFAVLHYCTLAQFCLAPDAAPSLKLNADDRRQLLSLVSADSMGHQFKVMVLSKNHSLKKMPPSWAVGDRRALL